VIKQKREEKDRKARRTESNGPSPRLLRTQSLQRFQKGVRIVKERKVLNKNERSAKRGTAASTPTDIRPPSMTGREKKRTGLTSGENKTGGRAPRGGNKEESQKFKVPSLPNQGPQHAGPAKGNARWSREGEP